jgi:TolA-binding protein
VKIKTFVLIIVLSIASCSKKNDLSLLEKADNEYRKKNFKTAIELYNLFVQKNPKDPKSPEALFKLAQIYLNDLRMPKEAVKIFEKIYETYPNTKEGMNSLFMLGFIHANELNDYKKAKIYYQKFIEKYPNSELATSAKFELENLGKEPEKIIQR